MAIITDPTLLNQGTEVTINTGARTITLNIAGNLSNDGVTLQALYSFFKEEWKDDPLLIPHPFPIVAITPERFDWVDDWQPVNDTTRKLIRTAGWRELDSLSVIQKEFAGIITLGTFEDPINDLVYYQQGTDHTDTNAAINFDFTGPVNEAVKTYDNVTPADVGSGFAFATTTITRNDGGNWITEGYQIGGRVEVSNAETPANDGIYVITGLTSTVITTTGLTLDAVDNTVTFAVDRKTAIRLFLRIRNGDPNGKTFDESDLSLIGITELAGQTYRFPLTNKTDAKISETDVNIASNSPFTEIVIRYFDQTYRRDVDSATLRDFGIVIDVGTHSGVDGVSNGTTTFTTTEGGIPGTVYDGGTLTIHNATSPDRAVHTIVSTTATSVTIDSALTNSETNLSFTLQRSVAVSASLEEIYSKVQYLLRQNVDIDSTDQTVLGKTANHLVEFFGDNLFVGHTPPNNPNSGGSGVFIEGFNPLNSNEITFLDNSDTERSFPFLAAGTIDFNANLVDDTGGEFLMFFRYTERFTNNGFGLSSPSTNTATLDSSTTDLVAELSNGDYIHVTGFTDPNNNGIWQLSGPPAGTGPWTAAITKVNGDTASAEAAGATISVDKNPIDTPDAITVQDNGGADIVGGISATVSFDFDYDNNVQGGRTPGLDAEIVIRAIGLETAEFVEVLGTIARNITQDYAANAVSEKNYLSP